MLTKKPISTISYLTGDYLSQCLNDALDRRDIKFWAYIMHKPDNDFGKYHFHVYAEPDKQVDTFKFNEKFIEVDPNNEKPLRCLEWRQSKFDDWYYYCMHDPDYLYLKGMERVYHYSESDFWFSDIDEWQYRISMIEHSAIAGVSEIVQAAKNLMPLADVIQKGIIPPAKLNSYLNLFKSVKSDTLGMIKDPMDKYKKEA